MKRLVAAIRHDVSLQFRHGFYHVYAVVSVAYAGLLFALPDHVREWLLPVLVYSDPAIFGFFLIGALVLFEKDAGTLQLIGVTPLRTGEYVAAKAISLGALSLAAASAIALIGAGFRFHVFIFILGVGLLGTLSALIGLVAVIHFRNLSTYLVGSAPIMVLFIVPIAEWAGGSAGTWQSALAYFIPVTPGFALIRGAFVGGLSPPAVALTTLLALGWNLLFYRWAVRACQTHVVRAEGGATRAPAD